MILKQNLTNHIIVFGFIWSAALMVGLGWYYFRFDTDYIFVMGIFYFIFILPAIYLHIEYYLENRGEEIEIRPNAMTIRRKGVERTFQINELDKIILYKSANLDKFSIPLSAMEYYRYLRIITKGGEQIIVTCLMTRNLEEVIRLFDGVKFERKKSFFCTLKWK
ncbi:hypothetical protein [Compostibacter hankyongensis]